jgi:UTP:GlnB (protein PII) uridylyltransferase
VRSGSFVAQNAEFVTSRASREFRTRVTRIGKRHATSNADARSVTCETAIEAGEDAGTMSGAAAEEFRRTMPAAYAAVYSSEEIAEHASIVARRGLQPVHLELWRAVPPAGAVLCVVADDHPGFLSTVSAVLYLHELDVATAQIYCRTRPDGVSEAVDLFWVRPANRSAPHRIEPDEIASIKRVLGELIVRQACPDPIAPRRTPEPDAVPLARAFFETAALRQGNYVLVVEALDFPGLLMSVARTLHHQKLDILASDIRTEGTRVHDRFMVADTSGEALSPERLASIRAAVVVALRTSMGEG